MHSYPRSFFRSNWPTKLQKEIRTSADHNTPKHCQGKKHKLGKELVVLHQNVQEISNKVDRISHQLQDTRPDVVILSEHGLKSDLLENTRLEDYCLKAHYCRENKRKGGVAIYVKDGLQQKVETVNVSPFCQELTCELAVVKVITGKEQLYIIGIYRSPSGNLDEALDILSRVLEETKAENHPLVIMGDINVNRLVSNNESKKLEEMLASHNVIRLPLPPTRITHSSTSSIDCICSNLHTSKISATVIHAGLSDHTAQMSKISLGVENIDKCHLIQRQMKRNNLDSLKMLLHEENWADVFNAPSAEEAYKSFINTLTLSLDAACPKQKSRPKGKKKFKCKDREALRLKEIYLQCLRRYETTGLNQHKLETATAKKSYDTRLKTLKRQASANHINNAENKSKAIWQIVNSERKTSVKGKEQLKLKVEEEEVTDPQEVVKIFNKFFTTIAQQTLSINDQHQKGVQPTSYMVNTSLSQLHNTTTEEIKSIIKSMKPKTSAGLDDVSSKLLKHCNDALIPPLVSIINKSLSSGLFPSALKVSKVYPKHKTGCQMTPSNYRPISLISTFSKIIERVVLNRLMDYLKENNLLTCSQHGFVKGKSTLTAIAELADFICDQLEAGKLVTGVMLDFSKAFDCLGHNLVLQKLKNLGLSGSAYNWFKSYLEERSQVVEIRHEDKGIVRNIRSKPLP